MSFKMRRRAQVALAVAGVSLLALTGCTGNGSGNETAEQDADAEVVIWTDATRQPAFEAYQAANPDANLKIETYDAAALLTKIQLFNRAGKGWPDVVFTGDPNMIAALASPLYDFAAPLDDLVEGDTLEEYGAGNDGCELQGTTYCLTNDIAQTVLWYDQALMDEFGYELPQTWDEYQALGAKVADEHPGYIVGAFSSFSYYDLFLSSGCPTQTVVDTQVVNIDLENTNCTRISSLLDPMLANGSVSRSGPFDPPVQQLAKDQKILMMPGASWFGDHVFAAETGYNYADGRIAAASYPTWEGESTPQTASAGGGIFVVSKHAKNLKGAAAAATFAATDLDVQTAAPTYPAYPPAAQAWCDNKQADTFYASDPCPVLEEAATQINFAASTPVVYAPVPVFSTTVVAKVTGGGNVEDGFADLQTQLTQLANQSGYAVQ